MGRPGLSANRKFKRLARTLGCPCLARGVLELMWDTCYESGDEFLGDAQDVADAAQWKGEPDVLVKALWEAGGEGRAGFIEDCPDEPGNYICHDLWDHAPEYVEKRFKRELARREKGITMRDQKVAAGQASGRARRLKANTGEHVPDPAGTGVEQKGTDGEQVLNTCRTHGETPSPSPSPVLIKCTSPSAQLAESSAEKPKKEKPKKNPAWSKPFPEDVVEVATEILKIWPDPKVDIQPRDDRGVRKPVPEINRPKLAGRLMEIKQEGGDLQVCLAIAQRYVADYRASDRVWMKAPQHFFGVRGPWPDLYQAHVTNEQTLELEEVVSNG